MCPLHIVFILTRRQDAVSHPFRTEFASFLMRGGSGSVRDMTDSSEEESEKNGRRYCTLAPQTLRYLKKLAKKGTHGTSVPDIMTKFIEEGVRQAIRENFLKVEDGES